MTHFNPEFRRNIWLQLSMHQLIAAPLILLTILYFAFLTLNGWSTVIRFSIWIFSIFTVAYGAYLTSGSLSDEVQARTWPIQRLTALSPWTMATGKIFGGPIFSWIVGLCCLAVILIAPYLAGNRIDNDLVANQYPFTTLILLVAFAVSAHAFALVYSLVELQKTRQLQRRAVIIPILVFFLATSFVGYVSTLILDPSVLSANVSWYYTDFHEVYFFTASLVVNMLWLLVAAYMLMRRELQFTNSPVIWLLFLVYQSAYWLGFSFDSKIENLLSLPINDITYTIPLNSIRIAIVFFIFHSASYLMAAVERVDTLGIRITWQRRDAKKWWMLMKVLPRWCLTSVITMVLAVVLLYSVHLEGYYQTSFAALIVASMAFMMRDIGLFVFFDLSNKSRSVLTAIIYLLLLYLIIPGLLKPLQLNVLMPFFYPNADYGYAYTVAAPIFEALLVWFMAKKAFNR